MPESLVSSSSSRLAATLLAAQYGIGCSLSSFLDSAPIGNRVGSRYAGNVKYLVCQCVEDELANASTYLTRYPAASCTSVKSRG